jgi:nitrogen regulatory protein PII
VFGSKQFKDVKSKDEVKNHMVDAIITIVEKGYAIDVIDAAQSAGARGATVIQGRGSGVNETQKLFNMEIEPEKEIILILSANKNTVSITNAIREKVEIDKPGKGLMFVQSVKQTYGLLEDTLI